MFKSLIISLNSQKENYVLLFDETYWTVLQKGCDMYTPTSGVTAFVVPLTLTPDTYSNKALYITRSASKAPPTFYSFPTTPFPPGAFSDYSFNDLLLRMLKITLTFSNSGVLFLCIMAISYIPFFHVNLIISYQRGHSTGQRWAGHSLRHAPNACGHLPGRMKRTQRPSHKISASRELTC